MTYHRVIPRDLFNEASLLKCYGRLAILLGEHDGHRARLTHEGDPFVPNQDAGSGSLTLWPCVRFHIGDGECALWRPLNSREPWPLYAMREDDPEFTEVSVFDDDGDLSPEFWALIMAKEPVDG